MLGVLGARRSLLFSILSYSVGTLLVVLARSYFTLGLAMVVLGFQSQFTSMLIAVIVNASFEAADAASFLAWCYTGFAACPLIWPLFMGRVINPEGRIASVEFEEEGRKVLYFDEGVTGNLDLFLLIQLVVHLVVCLPLAMIFSEPEGLKGDFKQWLDDALHCRAKKALNRAKESSLGLSFRFQKSIAVTLSKLPKNFGINFRERTGWKTQKDLVRERVRKFELERRLRSRTEPENKPPSQPEGSSCLAFNRFVSEKDFQASRVSKLSKFSKFSKLSKRPSDQILQEELFVETEGDIFVKSTLASKEFWLIFLVAFLRQLGNRGFLVCFKLIGLFYFKSDGLINFLASVCYFAYIAEGIFFGTIMKKLGNTYCHYLQLANTFIVHFLFVAAPNSLSAFILLSSVCRFGQGFNTMLNMSTVFGKYGNESGLLIYKYFDLTNLLGGYAAVKIVGAFGTDFETNLVVFGIVNLVGFCCVRLVDLEKTENPEKLEKSQIVERNLNAFNEDTAEGLQELLLSPREEKLK